MVLSNLKGYENSSLKKASENETLSLPQIEEILGIRVPEKEKKEHTPKIKMEKPAYKTAFKSVEKFLDKEPNYFAKLDKADHKEIERRVRLTLEKYFDEL